jgi:hypothetical protein
MVMLSNQKKTKSNERAERKGETHVLNCVCYHIYESSVSRQFHVGALYRHIRKLSQFLFECQIPQWLWVIIDNFGFSMFGL